MVDDLMNIPAFARDVENALRAFVKSRSIIWIRATNGGQIHLGYVMVYQNGRLGMFVMSSFIDYLSNRGWVVTANKIAKAFRQIGITPRGNTVIRGKQVRPWVVDLLKMDMNQ